MALAMVAAKSTDPKVWVNSITQVSSPPGTTCYDFVSCAALLSKHQKINYEGVAGNYDYNRYHSIFSAYGATAWNPDGTSRVPFTISQTELGSF
jgi:branched-chain amino acid transport system substrate-binding protein